MDEDFDEWKSVEENTEDSRVKVCIVWEITLESVQIKNVTLRGLSHSVSTHTSPSVTAGQINLLPSSLLAFSFL